MYSQKQKSTALDVFHQTNSVSGTIRILGYPAGRQLYTWTAAENMVKRERKLLPRFANPRIIREILRRMLNLMQSGAVLNTEKI